LAAIQKDEGSGKVQHAEMIQESDLEIEHSLLLSEHIAPTTLHLYLQHWLRGVSEAKMAFWYDKTLRSDELETGN
jgi:hypothetical protein